MTYGAELRLPAEFFVDSNNFIPNAANFVEKLSIAIRKFANVSRRYGRSPVYVPATLRSCSHVFVEEPPINGALKSPYKRPYCVVEQGEKTFKVNIDGETPTLTIDRLKPAFMMREPEPQLITTPSKLREPIRNSTERKVSFKGVYPK